MVCLGLITLFDWNGKTLTWNPALRMGLRRIWKYKAWFAGTLIFFMILASGLWSTDDFPYLLERLRIRLPFLLMPLVFATLPAFSQRQYRNIFYLLLVLSTILGFGVSINYLLHFEAIQESLKNGKAVPVPINHIRFSLLMGLATLGGVVLLFEKHRLKFHWEKWLQAGCTLWLFLFVHVLAVRSGLVALYLGLLVFALYYVFKQSSWKMGVVFLLGFLLVPLLAIKFTPSLQEKIRYMRYDYEMYKKGEGKKYSDSERIISLQAGVELVKDHPLLGVGYGDLKKEIREWYAQHYPDFEVKDPHNEFLMIAAGTGLLGLALFLGIWGFLLLYNNHYKDPFFLAFFTIVQASFMVESTIENSTGTTFVSFFLFLGIQQLASKSD
jgi:O-antigen ligase